MSITFLGEWLTLSDFLPLSFYAFSFSSFSFDAVVVGPVDAGYLNRIDFFYLLTGDFALWFVSLIATYL